MDLLDIIEKKDLLINRSPVIVATTAIYKSTIDCGEYRTQDNMEAITKITGVTIRNRYQELKSKLDELGITVR